MGSTDSGHRGLFHRAKVTLLREAPLKCLCKIVISLLVVSVVGFVSYSSPGNNSNPWQSVSSEGMATGKSTEKGDEVLELPCNVLTAPSWKEELSKLTELSLANCNLTTIPSEIGQCTALTKLDLAKNDIVTLPDTLSELEQLDILFILGSRRMTKIPSVLSKMTSITRLGLRSNGIQRIEKDQLPPNVVHLILTDNGITHIHDEAYPSFRNVRKLMLSNNQLTNFGGDDPLANLPNLELVRLANNQLDANNGLHPDVLNLPKLSWIAMAGNLQEPPTNTAKRQKQSDTDKKVKEIPSIQISSLQMTDVSLGKGASGDVRVAKYDGKDVAVKKLAITSSDGRAVDEIQIAKRVFSTSDETTIPDSLIRVFAVCHPDDNHGQAAVVMEKLPTDNGLRDLAKPPTIVEVTQDRYDQNDHFGKNALHILLGVSSALVYLHELHISHGDVYSHNTLIAETNRGSVSSELTLVKLGDFGAAFDYSAFSAEHYTLFEKIEVRAFGVMVSELAERLLISQEENKSASQAFLQEKLILLAGECLSPKVTDRPTFKQIVEQLSSMEQ